VRSKFVHALPCKVDADTLEKVKVYCREQGIPASGFIRNLIMSKLFEVDP
jgi:hypothetical protein